MTICALNLRTLVNSPIHRVYIAQQQQCNAAQVRALRHKQAAAAFIVGGVRKDARYVVVDDVSTTGATLEYAARTLLEAGAHEVWVAVLATQPLEKSAGI